MKIQFTTYLPKLLFIALSFLSFVSFAQLPSNVLVGYWHNWENLRIKDVDPRYNVIMLSFLEADTDFNVDNNVIADLSFDIYGGNKTNLKADIPVVQAKGKKVLVSIGGGNGSFKLNNDAEKDLFVSKVKAFIQEYGVDGIDIDIEQKTYIKMSSGTLLNPEAHIQRIIDAIKEIYDWYQIAYSKKMLLTMAPEVLYVQGGMSPSAEAAGSFLPIIEQLRDELDLLMVQLYNTGTMFDLDGIIRSPGTSTFIVAMTEAVIRGFPHAKGWGDFSGLPASKVAVALPSCPSAGSGFVSSNDMIAAMKYLRGTGPKAGDYKLKKASGYSDLRGLMTWSINNDFKTSCGGASYSFADAAEASIGTISTEKVEFASFSIFPNPVQDVVTIQRNSSETTTVEVFDNKGALLKSVSLSANKLQLDISELPSGFYFVRVDGESKKMIK